MSGAMVLWCYGAMVHGAMVHENQPTSQAKLHNLCTPLLLNMEYSIRV